MESDPSGAIRRPIVWRSAAVCSILARLSSDEVRR
jgi:hypothetical protein